MRWALQPRRWPVAPSPSPLRTAAIEPGGSLSLGGKRRRCPGHRRWRRRGSGVNSATRSWLASTCVTCAQTSGAGCPPSPLPSRPSLHNRDYITSRHATHPRTHGGCPDPPPPPPPSCTSLTEERWEWTLLALTWRLRVRIRQLGALTGFQVCPERDGGVHGKREKTVSQPTPQRQPPQQQRHSPTASLLTPAPSPPTHDINAPSPFLTGPSTPAIQHRPSPCGHAGSTASRWQQMLAAPMSDEDRRLATAEFREEVTQSKRVRGGFGCGLPNLRHSPLPPHTHTHTHN